MKNLLVKGVVVAIFACLIGGYVSYKAGWINGRADGHDDIMSSSKRGQVDVMPNRSASDDENPPADIIMSGSKSGFIVDPEPSPVSEPVPRSPYVIMPSSKSVKLMDSLHMPDPFEAESSGTNDQEAITILPGSKIGIVDLPFLKTKEIPSSGK
jgi:hypothetical protein